MITGTTITKDAITPAMERIQKELAQYPQQALAEFKDLTPVRKGNARRKTTLQNEKIEANYPYAQRLDEGWSNQAPDGMSKPTEKELSRLLDKKIRK